MNKKLFLIIFIFFVLSGALLVSALTLTREFTRMVIVPLAASGEVCLWDSTYNQCIQDLELVVWGTADVYPTWEGGPYPMTLIVFRDNIYRGYGGWTYYQENCRTILEGVDPVKGEIWKEVCETTLGIKEEEGAGSQITETGLSMMEEEFRRKGTMEYKDVFRYKISYNKDGSYKDLVFTLPGGNETFQLQSIGSTVTDIRWEPK